MPSSSTLLPNENDLEDLASELTKTFAGGGTTTLKPNISSLPTQNAERTGAPSARLADQLSKLPMRLEGGFAGLGSDLDTHARKWKNAVRVLEQLRTELEAVELEGSRLQASLTRVIPEIANNGKSLSSHLNKAKAGDLSADLSSEFAGTLEKLDDLERLSEALTVNHLAMQSTWEQYAKAVLQAQRLRDGFKSS